VGQRFFAVVFARREVERVVPRDDARFAAVAPVRLRDAPADRRRGAGGTSAPFARASFKPIAIACLRLRTRPPDPLRRLPRLRRRIAEATVFDALDFLLAILVLRECDNANHVPIDDDRVVARRARRDP
jgi:hypothetical protein